MLSFKISISLNHNFCCQILQEAIENYGKPIIFNTDLGAQFDHGRFYLKSERAQYPHKYGWKGQDSDSIVVQRFWCSLKQEKN